MFGWTNNVHTVLANCHSQRSVNFLALPMHRDSPEFEDPNAMNVDSEEKKPNDAGSSAEEDEEYEIEQILDAKRGAFANVSFAFCCFSFV